jgi:hypothetical protein
LSDNITNDKKNPQKIIFDSEENGKIKEIFTNSISDTSFILTGD